MMHLNDPLCTSVYANSLPKLKLPPSSCLSLSWWYLSKSVFLETEESEKQDRLRPRVKFIKVLMVAFLGRHDHFQP